MESCSLFDFTRGEEQGPTVAAGRQQQLWAPACNRNETVVGAWLVCSSCCNMQAALPLHIKRRHERLHVQLVQEKQQLCSCGSARDATRVGRSGTRLRCLQQLQRARTLQQNGKEREKGCHRTEKKGKSGVIERERKGKGCHCAGAQSCCCF